MTNDEEDGGSSVDVIPAVARARQPLGVWAVRTFADRGRAPWRLKIRRWLRKVVCR